MYFVDFKKTEQVAVESLAINPSTTQELKCPTNHNLKEGATIEYRWTQDSVDMEDTTYSIVISADASLNETLIEMYECTASVNGDAKLGTLMYAFNLTQRGRGGVIIILFCVLTWPSAKKSHNIRSCDMQTINTSYILFLPSSPDLSTDCVAQNLHVITYVFSTL